MHNRLLVAIMAAALAITVFGSSAVARDNHLAGITITPVQCFTSIDGDTEVAGQQIGFIFKLANTGTAAKAVKPSFDVPIEAKPMASATVKVSSVLRGGCEQAANGYKWALPISCSSTVVTGVGIRRWNCTNVTVPAGSWRLVTFVGRFGKTSNRWTQFWTTTGGSQTAHYTIRAD